MSYSAMAHALIGYVEGHMKNFSLKEMSESFGFSEAYLRELFLKHVNMPIMQYCKRRKMIASAFELLHSDKTILEIALESGFLNPESYTRAFQKVFHMSPSRFRQERPPIGRKRLEEGVFGLERLSGREKKSGETEMWQNGEKTILYGIREIGQGAYESSSMFPICVKAVSEYLGDDVSYAYIMAATGAAFRFIWNRAEWDLSNVDMYHALREGNEIYQYGAKALGREFSFLERKEGTTKEEFAAYMKAAIAKGYPVIALGIIGPPEPCIVAGFEAEGEAVAGWNFFQNDPEFSAAISTMDNGYFWCDTWWENTDTQAVMSIGGKADTSYGDKDIVKRALDIMEAREENTYAKGIRAYDAWQEMLLCEKWFQNGSAFDDLFLKLLVQNDAMACISDGRKWAAEYFEELAVKYGDLEKKLCRDIAGHFHKASRLAGEMMLLLGDRSKMQHHFEDRSGGEKTQHHSEDRSGGEKTQHHFGDRSGGEKTQNHFGDRTVREKLCQLIEAAKQEDGRAYEQMKRLYSRI